MMRKKSALLTPVLMLASLVYFCPGPDASTITIEARRHTALTSDDWEISIDHYFIESGKPRMDKATVVLCHGFNFNSLFWDLDDSISLAKYLTLNGYDVWVPSLRGSGASSKPVISGMKELNRIDLAQLSVRNIQEGLTKAAADFSKGDWTIDDHINKDLPAIVDYVIERSGQDQLYWIGHSMGGIIMYAYLETVGQERIAGFIPIGTMMMMPPPLNEHLIRIAEQESLTKASLIFNTRAAADLRNLTRGVIQYPIEDILLKRENMDEALVQKLFAKCVEDTSAGVVGQFAQSIRFGRMTSASGEVDYSKMLDRITVPTLFMVGGVDGFVTEGALRLAFEGVSSNDKKIMVISKEKGFSADYGHCDILLGRKSKDEVYPVILDWLDWRTQKVSIVARIKRYMKERFSR